MPNRNVNIKLPVMYCSEFFSSFFFFSFNFILFQGVSQGKPQLCMCEVQWRRILVNITVLSCLLGRKLSAGTLIPFGLKDRKNWKLKWYWVILKPHMLPYIVLDSGFTPSSSQLCSKQSNTNPMKSIALTSRFSWLSCGSLDLRWSGIPSCWHHAKSALQTQDLIFFFGLHSRAWNLSFLPPWLCRAEHQGTTQTSVC